MALSLKEVRDFLYDIRLKWYDLGLELEVKEEDLDEIRVKYKDDPSDCQREMIKIWLRFVDNPPTWNALAKALRAKAIKEIALAIEGNDGHAVHLFILLITSFPHYSRG